MLEKIIKDYFSFSRKERTAVLVLVSLVTIIFLLPYFVPEDSSLSKKSLEKIRQQVEQRPTSASRENGVYEEHKGKPIYDGSSNYAAGLYTKSEAAGKSVPFYFDPNTLQVEGWKKLGLRNKTIATIRNYLAKGGKFKRKEDIGRIYGILPDEIERLEPYVRIVKVEPGFDSELRRTTFQKEKYAGVGYEPYKKSMSFPATADINTADTATLIALPGIGSKLAARIILFRERLGGFYSINQLSEIYGLQDSVFQKIRPRLSLTNPGLRHINVNMATEAELKTHPYLRWNIAAAIIEYRSQHGNFETLDELKKIALITEDLYNKITPYLKIE